MPFTRRELQELRDRAHAATATSDLEWKCLSELAHAADQLDALYARQHLDAALAVVETLDDADLDEIDPFSADAADVGMN
jgi:hypothetical protein